MFWCKLIMAAAVSGEVFWEWNNNPAAAEWFVTMSGSNAASLLLKSALNCLGSATRTTAERERSVKVEPRVKHFIWYSDQLSHEEVGVWGVRSHQMIASKGRGFLRGNWSTWTIIRAETRSLMYLLRAVSIPSPSPCPGFPFLTSLLRSPRDSRFKYCPNKTCRIPSVA